VSVVTLILAHNEEACVADSIRSLCRQTRTPYTVVLADNCTDGTEKVDRREGIQVFRTAGNLYKKAGALN
jgi:biofilm PGA synthesis N-glycosyltransferase PgaC